MDILDKALSLEGVNLDKDGAMESIRGLSDELMNNSRFNEVKTLSDIDFRTSCSFRFSRCSYLGNC